MGTASSRLLLAALLLVSVTSLFAFSKKEAFDAFSKLGTAEYPVKSGDYLFFRYKWKTPQEATQEEREEEQMEAQFEVLESYLCKGLQELRIRQSPFGVKLTKLILPPFSFKLPEIEMVNVKEEEQDGEHIGVFACNPSEIETLKAKLKEEAMQVGNYSAQQWAALLKKAFDSLKREEDRRSFLTLLGCPIVTFLRERGIRLTGNRWPPGRRYANCFPGLPMTLPIFFPTRKHLFGDGFGPPRAMWISAMLLRRTTASSMLGRSFTIKERTFPRSWSSSGVPSSLPRTARRNGVTWAASCGSISNTKIP